MNLSELTNTYVEEMWQWLQDQVLTMPVLIQCSLIVAALLFGLTAARALKRVVSSRIETLPVTHFIRKINNDLLQQQITLVMVLFSEGVVTLLMVSLEQSAIIMLVTLKLLCAWVLIRFVVMLSGNSASTRLLTTIVWGIAALSIVGVLNDTIGTLENIRFSIGKAEVSVFSILSGLLTMAILLYVAGKLSGVVERKIQYIPNLTPSARVLIKKVSKVFLLVLAFIIGLNSMGIDLTALAVFGGAVGLGIGFGLQKVISNLFSGFILLLDRSIKPGDVIEIDNTFGWVNALGARYVSILTRDGIEHLVPNEHLITERVTNWSYSSKDVRQKIPLGVSYNADLHKAIELVVAVAENHKRVLSNPTPVCRVTGFGDNAIDMELRVWICDPVEGVMNIRSDILLGIYDAFKEHGIEIPFPQRDVHLKPSAELQEMFEELSSRRKEGALT